MVKDLITIGFLGMGTVGSGALKILQDNRASIEQKIGAQIRVKKIAVAHLTKPRPPWVDRSLLTDRPEEVLEDPEIDIVVETIGGLEPAKSYMLRAIRNRKSVVTANKEVIARDGHELLMEAARQRVDFFFEGAVAGGIPIIRPLKIDLAGNRIERIIGIVNGTTNYILTKMTYEGRDFQDVLQEAQKLGYAEADPTYDIDGYDAAYKLAILASVAFQSQVPVDQVYHEGIRKVSARDIRYAQELGYVIKLLAIAKQSERGMELRVHPALVHARHPLSAVNDVFNALFIHGDAIGDVMFYGRGAGSLPTGSAVVGDIIDICKNLQFNSLSRISCTCFESKTVVPIEEVVTRYYIRMVVADQPGVLAQTAGVFGRYQVSIASVVQKEASEGDAEIVWITHPAKEANMQTALREIAELPVVREISTLIRVED